MPDVGSIVYYAGSGVCRIAETKEMETAGVTRRYYVLTLLFKPASTLYVPFDSETLAARMVPLLTPEEIDAALAKAASTEPDWERNYRRRSDVFRRTLLTTDRAELLFLIKAVYRHRRSLAENGKALHTTDDYFLRDAEDLVYPEFSHVLGEPLAEVSDRVLRAIL